MVETLHKDGIGEDADDDRGNARQHVGAEADGRCDASRTLEQEQGDEEPHGHSQGDCVGDDLTGTDDRGVEVAAKVFNGKVESKSGQVNWQGLRSKAPGHEREYQLVLVNHAEATDVTITAPFGFAPASARIFDPAGRSRAAEFSATAKRVSVRIPKQQMMIIVWTPVE